MFNPTFNRVLKAINPAKGEREATFDIDDLSPETKGEDLLTRRDKIFDDLLSDHVHVDLDREGSFGKYNVISTVSVAESGDVTVSIVKEEKCVQLFQQLRARVLNDPSR